MKKNKIFAFGLILLLLLFSVILLILYENEREFNELINISRSVEIVVYTDEKGHPSSEGTGIPIDTNFILTNYHVVKYPQKIQVLNNGNIIEAYLKAYDLKSDLAIIETSAKLTPIKISSEGIELGQKVLVDHKSRLEEGYIVDKLQTIPGYLGSLFKYIKIKDINTEYGSSGGAVLNSKGELIGVVSARIKENDLIETYAIPIKEAFPIVNTLMNGQNYDHITLGIEMADISLGVLVERVSYDSLAYNKLSKGDIIQNLNGNQIKNIHDLLYELFNIQKLKKDMIFEILRDGNSVTIKL